MKKFILPLMLSLFFFAISGSSANAALEQLDPNTDYLQALNQVCGVQLVVADAVNGEQELKFLSTMVHCFETAIKGLAEGAMQKLSEGLTDAVNAAMVLFVILFGVKFVTGGVQSPKSEVVLVALKIGVVAWLVNNLGIMDMWFMTLSAYEDVLSIMITPAQVESCPAQFVSLDYVWDTMDCLFSKMIGFGAQNGFGNSWQGVALLLSTAVAKTDFGSGLIIPAVIANAMFTILFSFLRIAMAYIISLLGLAMLFALAPLMLPMMFFKLTFNYFEAWYKMIISFILQVTILFAFTSFAFAIMGQIIDGPEGITALFGGTQISNEVTRTDTLGTNTQYWQRPTAVFTDAMEGKGDINLIVNFISILVLGYLMLSFIGVIGSIAQELSGSSAFPNLMNSGGEGGMNLPIPKV